MRLIVPLLVALAAFGSAPASAEIYRWVDESGVTHYSDQPPANRAHKADLVSQDRVSTYQSDPVALRAMAEAASRIRADNLARRVDRLERELAAARGSQYAATDASALQQQAYEQCLAERRVDCDQPYAYAGSYAYAPQVVMSGRRFIRRSAPFVSVPGVTGVTAGNVVTFRNAPPPRSRPSFERTR